MIIALCLFFTAVFLAFDLLVPLGKALIVLYILVVILAGRTGTPKIPIAFAALSTLFIGIGWFVAPVIHASDPAFVATNRLLALFVVWVIAVTIALQLRTEQARSAADEFTQAILESAPIASIVVDGEGRIVRVNRQTEELFGYECDELLNQHVEMLVPSVTRERHVQDRRAYLSRPRVRPMGLGRDLRGRRKDGSAFPVEVALNPVETSQGLLVLAAVVDITERENARAALQQSESRFRATFENAAVGVAHVAIDGHWLRVNQRLCEIVGYPAHELLAKTFQDITYPDDLEQDLTNVGRLLAGEIGTYSMEKRYIRKDGSIVWINLTVSLVRDERGEPDYFIPVIEEISQKKRAERVMAESKRQLERQTNELETLYQTAPVGLAVVDRKHRILKINQWFVKRNGGHVQNSIGRDYRELMPDIAEQLEALTVQVFNTGQPVIDAEIRSDTSESSAEKRFFLVNYSPIHAPDGKVDAIQCVLSDITDRIRAEQARRRREHRFRVMADSIPEIVFTNRADGACDYQNARFYELTGMASGKAQGWGWMEALHPEDVQRCREEWRTSVRTGAPYECRYRLRLADGEYRWFIARSRPLFKREGRLIQWSGAVTDIHELVLAEKALSEARAAAEVANRAKSEFLASMSHEIRTPMTAIMGFLDVLLSHTPEPDDLQSLPIIKRNAEYLLELINNILDLSKIEAHKLELQKACFSLQELVSDVHGSISVRAREKGLPLSIEYDGLIPETLEGDRTRVRQILMNLITNAIKFTDRGQVRVFIRFLSDEINPGIQFQVTDTGIGITPHELRLLFHPFAQGNHSAKRRQGGTGLGLTITNRLVESLGGQIAVDSQPGKGSTFTVTLPTAPIKEVTLIEADNSVLYASSPSAELRNLQHNCRVLVVDDRRDIRLLIQHFLEEAGVEVTPAENGRNAIETIEEAHRQGQPFDVIIMDMQMPVMDGYTATRELRGRGFKRPIIALTASAMKGEREDCLAVGCDDYLSKPVTQSDLVAAVARYSRDEDYRASNVEHASKHVAPTRQRSDARRKGNPSRILVVEDHEDAANATGMLLELLGYQVRVALDGESALNCARTFRPQVALLDLGLPDMHGHELLRVLKAQGLAATRFIALSGRSEPEDETQAFAAGFNHYLVKPLDLERLKLLLAD
jgi:PAS domain S-box-containing protein